MIYFVSMLAILISVTAIVMFLYWQTHVMEKRDTAMKILATALGPIALAVCNVCIFATQPILAIKYERNPTWTMFERNVTIRLFLFQILNAALTVLIFVYMDLDFHVRCFPKVDIPIDPLKLAHKLTELGKNLSADLQPGAALSDSSVPDGVCGFDSFWFSTGGVTVINSMIGDIAFINVVLEYAQSACTHARARTRTERARATGGFGRIRCFSATFSRRRRGRSTRRTSCTKDRTS